MMYRIKEQGRKNAMKRWISLLLVFAMTFSLCGGINLTAYADDGGSIALTEESTEHVHDHVHEELEEYSEENNSYTPEEPAPTTQYTVADAAINNSGSIEHVDSQGDISNAPIDVGDGVTIELTNDEDTSVAKAASNGDTILAFTSDVHNTGSTSIGTWIDSI